MPQEDKSPLYAKALIGLAEAAGRTAAVDKDFKAVVSLIKENTGILKFAANRIIDGKGKDEAFEEILNGHIDPLLTLFFRVLLLEGQINHIEQISSMFSELVAAKRSQISGEIISATQLPEHIIKEIEAQISRLLNKDVSLHPCIDTEILGGVLVKVGDFVIDGTIDAGLDHARTALMA